MIQGPLFTKFLAEELDLDYLALFLRCRDVCQNTLLLQLKELNPQPLNDVTHAFPDPKVRHVKSRLFVFIYLSIYLMFRDMAGYISVTTIVVLFLTDCCI